MNRKSAIRKLSLTLVFILALVMTWSGCTSAQAITEANEVMKQGKRIEFSDVGKHNWFYDNVTEMAEFGYLKGYEDGSFKPNKTITAAEFVSVVARVKGLKGETPQNSHWAGEPLQEALSKGWYDWDEIPPTAENYDSPIYRQLAVKVLMKAFAPDVRGDWNTETSKMNDFSQVDGRYYDQVIAAYSKDIVVGDDLGNFNPKKSLTRAEACAMIMRAVDKLGVDTEIFKDYDSNLENNENENKTEDAVGPAPNVPTTTVSGGVSENGQLKVIGTQLCNEKGNPIVLRGMSSHGIHWFPKFLSKDIIASTQDYGANLFRVAMYTGENGYISNPKTVKETLIKTVDNAISLDMYVIIDWHILSDGNPNTYISQSKAFFTEMAKRYKDNPAVIYEICNEPNGNVSWSGDVKPYAETIIKTIREIDSDAVILVGSPTWSQDLHEVAKSPIKAGNIMYTCHFYAGTHTDWLRNRISDAMKKGIPVFVSEWGTSDASGSGGVYLQEAERWIKFMEDNNISWANWSLCDKNESSAAIKSGANVTNGIKNAHLTESGKFVFEHFN